MSIVRIMSVRCGHPLRLHLYCQIRYGYMQRLCFRCVAPMLPYVGIKYATLLVFAKFTKYVKNRWWICMYPASLEFVVSVKSNSVLSDLLPASFQLGSDAFRFFSSSSTTSVFVDVTVRHVVFNLIKSPPASGLTFISTLCCTGWTNLVSGSINYKPNNTSHILYAIQCKELVPCSFNSFWTTLREYVPYRSVRWRSIALHTQTQNLWDNHCISTNYCLFTNFFSKILNSLGCNVVYIFLFKFNPKSSKNYFKISFKSKFLRNISVISPKFSISDPKVRAEGAHGERGSSEKTVLGTTGWGGCFPPLQKREKKKCILINSGNFFFFVISILEINPIKVLDKGYDYIF